MAALSVAVQTAPAQGILKTNLIVNGNAEAGPAGTGIGNVVASIPGWTPTGQPNVLPYGLTGLVLLSNPAPPDHGFQYFAASSQVVTSSLTQNIDVSSGASIIAGGNVKYTASAYLGSTSDGRAASSAQMAAAFKNANGQTFSTATVGPLGFSGSGMSLQQQIGLVPAGTVSITITLTLIRNCTNNADCGYAVADSLSLVLTTLGTSAGSVLSTNLVVNGNAEAGPGVALPAIALYVPGWSTANGASVAPYGGAGWIQVSDPGPADRGVNLFSGGLNGANSYQDIDVSPAATLIDAGEVTYEVSAWLGGLQFYTSPTLTYTFYNWTGTQLAPTAHLGPTSHSVTALLDTSFSGTLPVGTRRVHIALTFPSADDLVDDVAFTLASPAGPPGPVTIFSPAQDATGVSLTPTLTWTAVSGVTSYDVYFGTSATPSFGENTIGTSYAPATLNPGSTYYWYLVSRNAAGTTSSATWSFTTATSSYPAFFNGQASLGSVVYYLQFSDGNLFGYYNLTNFPIFYHYDMGFEGFVDGGNGAAYLYDFTSSHWFYTSSSLFPYLYDFTLNAWIYYFPDTKNAGHYTTNPRYFSNLTTGKIFTM